MMIYPEPTNEFKPYFSDINVFVFARPQLDDIKYVDYCYADEEGNPQEIQWDCSKSYFTRWFTPIVAFLGPCEE